GIGEQVARENGFCGVAQVEQHIDVGKRRDGRERQGGCEQWEEAGVPGHEPSRLVVDGPHVFDDLPDVMTSQLRRSGKSGCTARFAWRKRSASTWQDFASRGCGQRPASRARRSGRLKWRRAVRAIGYATAS